MARVYRDPTMRNAEGKSAWCLDYKGLDCKRHRDRTNAATREEAERLLRMRLSEIDKATIVGAKSVDQLKGVKLNDFIEEVYTPFAKAMKTANSASRDDQALIHLKKRFGGYKLTDISTAMIQGYAQDRVAGKGYDRSVKPSTVNRELYVLSAVFREAFKREYVSVNPVRRVTKFRQGNILIRYLTEKEEKALLARAPGYMKPIITVAIHTGLRKGELLSLAWTDVDFEQRLIRVLATKTGKTRYVPINDVAWEAIQGLDRHINSPYVFTNPETGTRWCDLKPYWYRTITPALQKQEIQHIRFHDLRHTFASRLAQRGVPLNDIRELLGHGSMTMTLRYAHLAPSNLRNAVDVLATGTAGVRVGRRVAENHASKTAAV